MADLMDMFDQVNEQLKGGTSVVDQETAFIGAFPGYRAALRIENENEVIAVMTVAGKASIVAEAIKWTADAFKEDEER